MPPLFASGPFYFGAVPPVGTQKSADGEMERSERVLCPMPRSGSPLCHPLTFHSPELSHGAAREADK